VNRRTTPGGRQWLAALPVLIVAAAPWLANTPGRTLLGLPALLTWMLVALLATSAVLSVMPRSSEPPTADPAQKSGHAAAAPSPLERWALGGRSFGSVLVFVLLAGEIYTTFTLLGASGWAYGRGAPTFYILGYGALAYLMSYWLLPAIWTRGRRDRVLTQPEFFARAFASPLLGRFVALVGVLSLLPYLVLQFRGLSILVHESAYGAISQELAVSIGAITVVGWVVLGGMKTSAYAALAKDVLVLVAVVALGLLIPQSVYGGIGPMFDAQIARDPEFFVLPARGFSPTWFVSTVTVSVVGFYLWPHTFASLFAARDPRGFERTAITMPLYQLVMLFVFFVGFAARDVVPGLTGADIDLALLRSTRSLFGPPMMLLVGTAGLLTALVPSAIILMTMATILAQLRHAPLSRADGDRASADLRLARWLVPAVALVAWWWSRQSNAALVPILLLAYAMVAQLAPALAMALWAPGRLRVSFIIAGIVVGELCVAASLWPALDTATRVAQWWPSVPSFVYDINPGLFALALNLTVLAIGAFSSRSMGTSPPPRHMTTGD
jgi:SSS family solute:Na+ symporter